MKQSNRKHQNPRRLAAVLLAGTMAVSLLPAAAFAVQTEALPSDMLSIIASAQVQSDAFDFDNDSDAEQLSAAAAAFPASFDLRSCDTDGDGVPENYVTPVKLQNPFGTCWGFGATAAAEISLLGSGLAQADGYGATADPDNGIKELNLSEKHLAYFTFAAINDRNNDQNGEGLQYPDGTTAAEKLNSGGFTFYATGRYASGMGPNLEDRSGLDAGDEDILVYHGKNGFLEFRKADTENDGNYSLVPVWYSEQDDWSIPEQYRFYASYRLKESYELPSPASQDAVTGEYEYNEAGTSAIKEQLLEKRGVSIAFHAESYLPGQTPAEKTYMSENWAHYTWDQQSANHAVCIVGWDDNYPKESFLDGHQPPADGAWLVKNSWGASTNSGFANNGYRYWGIRDADGQATGYFWLSFYDQSLTSPEAFAFDKSNVGHQYYVQQYDYMPVSSVNEVTVDTETGMANVFRADGDSKLSELSFQTATPGVTVTYSVYLLDEDYDNPVEGSPVVTGSASCQYGGYHKVTLPESQQVDMKQGQVFSVAIKEQTPAGKWTYVLPQSLSADLRIAMGGKNTAAGVINEKESYFFTDSSWHDMADKNFIESLLGEGADIMLVLDNFPIKAYLEPTGAVVNEGVDPDPQVNREPAYDGKFTMDIGGDVLLYPAATTNVTLKFFGKDGDITDPEQAITWTSSDTSVFTLSPINDPKDDGKMELTGVNPGTATLTVDAGIYGKASVTVTVENRKLEAALLDTYAAAYTGSPIEPKLSLITGSKLDSETRPPLEEGKDYKLEYRNNVLCGEGQVIVTGLGEYAGSSISESLTTFTIVPARPEITDTALDQDKLTVQFASQEESGVSGYALSWYPVEAGGAEPQTLPLGADAISADISGLEAGKTYAVVLRAYVAVDSEDSQEPGVEYGDPTAPVIVTVCSRDGSCPVSAFTDANPDAWYHDGVHWALDQGVMTGVDAKAFQPGATATRAMVVTMLWRMAGEPESSSDASFPDVKRGAWYAEAVDWAAENQIVTGYSDTVFAPSDNVTREQLATILYRFDNIIPDDADLSSVDMETVLAILAVLMQGMGADSEPVVLPFDDAGSISDWAQDAMEWAWSAGIINGKTATTLAPKDKATRAEVATMLMRYCAASTAAGIE